MEGRPTLALATLLCWIGLVSAPNGNPPGTIDSDTLFRRTAGAIASSDRNVRPEDMVRCGGRACPGQVFTILIPNK